MCVTSHNAVTFASYNWSISEDKSFQERSTDIMGNSLHNKIYLGRTTFGSRLAQTAVAVGSMVAIALAWIAVRTYR